MLLLPWGVLRDTLADRSFGCIIAQEACSGSPVARSRTRRVECV